jgi:hypothetical protein
MGLIQYYETYSDRVSTKWGFRQLSMLDKLGRSLTARLPVVRSSTTAFSIDLYFVCFFV